MTEQHLLLCRYHYDPLDRLAGIAADSELPSLLGFNGEWRDPTTEHYLLGNGYRAFNPVLMRFNSPDSFSPFGAGGLNAYAYCQGDPVNHQDSTGHIIGPGYRTPMKVMYDPFTRERRARLPTGVVAPRQDEAFKAMSVNVPRLNARDEHDIWIRNTSMGSYGDRPFDRYRIHTLSTGEAFHALGARQVAGLDPPRATQLLNQNERLIDLIRVTDTKSFVVKKYALSSMQELYASDAVMGLDRRQRVERLQAANRRALELRQSAVALRGT